MLDYYDAVSTDRPFDDFFQKVQGQVLDINLMWRWNLNKWTGSVRSVYTGCWLQHVAAETRSACPTNTVVQRIWLHFKALGVRNCLSWMLCLFTYKRWLWVPTVFFVRWFGVCLLANVTVVLSYVHTSRFCWFVVLLIVSVLRTPGDNAVWSEKRPSLGISPYEPVC